MHVLLGRSRTPNSVLAVPPKFRRHWKSFHCLVPLAATAIFGCCQPTEIHEPARSLLSTWSLTLPLRGIPTSKGTTLELARDGEVIYRHAKKVHVIAVRCGETCHAHAVCLDRDGRPPTVRTDAIPGGFLSRPVAHADGSISATGVVTSSGAPLPFVARWSGDDCRITTQVLQAPQDHITLAALAVTDDAQVALVASAGPTMPMALASISIVGFGVLLGKLTAVHPTANTLDHGHLFQSWWRLLRGSSRLYAVGWDQVVGEAEPIGAPYGVFASGFDLKLTRVAAARLDGLSGQAEDAVVVGSDDLLVSWLRTIDSGPGPVFPSGLARYNEKLQLVWMKDELTPTYPNCAANVFSGEYEGAFVSPVVGTSMRITRADRWGGLAPKLPSPESCANLVGHRGPSGAALGFWQADRFELRLLDRWGNLAGSKCDMDCEAGPCEIADCEAGVCRTLPRPEGDACGVGMVCVAGVCG